MAEKSGNRSKLLEVALQLFSLRGYEAIGIQEIVDEAGVTKPTLYHYFGNKQGLLEALLENHSQELLNAINFAAQYQGDLPLTLYRVADVYFNFAKNHMNIYRMYGMMRYSAPESVPYKVVLPFLKKQHQILEQLFIAAVQNHGNLRGHHSAYVITFVGIITSYIAYAHDGYAELNDKLTNEAVKQFMYGIYSL